MRHHYIINKKLCHFHYNNSEPLHEVEDIMSLLNLSKEAKAQLIEDWNDHLVFMPDSDPAQSYRSANFFRCIPEKHLPGFLHQAQEKQKAPSILRLDALITQILNGRLDAIVGNKREHFAHTSAAARKDISKVSRTMYRFAYEAMEIYEKNRTLSAAQINSWHKIKDLLPPRVKPSTERHLFALLSMIASLWPTQVNPAFLTPLGIKTHEGICKIISILNNNELTEHEKSIVFFEAIKNIGNDRNSKQSPAHTPPEP